LKVRGPVVTIDGPAGVGKSTVGRRVAIELHVPFIDTGIFYRALAVAASRRGIAAGDGAALAELASRLDLKANTDPLAGPDAWQALVDGGPLGAELWDPRHAALLAGAAGQPQVRAALLHFQREPAREGGLLVGRDTGTVVFPDADCRVYLDAPAEVRVARRRRELEGRGQQALDDELRAEMEARDRTDLSRNHGPLAVPADALEIQTAHLSAEQVVERILAECHRLRLRSIPGRRRP
jgi:cytidylate kinase